MENKQMMTMYGIFKDNLLVNPISNTSLECVSYNSLRNKMEGKEGFHNLEWEESISSWIIFQFIEFPKEELINFLKQLES